MLSVFISGLQRQSGKTIITAGLAGTMQSLSYTTCVYKPIQTAANTMNGFLQSQDLALIKRIDANIHTHSSYMFTSPKSPLIGAYQNGPEKVELKTICKDFQNHAGMSDCRIIEGANSISTPYNDKLTEIHIAKELGIPILLVVNPKMSSIDDVILGINYIEQNRADFLGVIINDYNEHAEDLEERYFPALVQEYSKAKILGTVPHYEDFMKLTPDTLISDVLNNIQLEEIFGLKIAKLNE